MSSTERDARETLAREFYRNELAPLADRQRRAGKRSFEVAPDPTCDSYFKRRAKTRFSRADFEAHTIATPAALGAALGAFWERTGDVELAALAPAFGALAARLYDVDDQKDSVTPFMYVMF